MLNRPNVYEIVPYLKEVNHYFGHFIHQFAFESEMESQYSRQVLDPNIKRILGIDRSPLDEIYSHVSANLPSPFGANGRPRTDIYLHPRQTESAEYMFQYFLKVVSTKYKSLNGDVVRTLSTHSRSGVTNPHICSTQRTSIVPPRTSEISRLGPLAKTKMAYS